MGLFIQKSQIMIKKIITYEEKEVKGKTTPSININMKPV